MSVTAVKTGAVVLHSTKYSDSQRIIQTYTESYGRISFIVRTSGKEKSNIQNILYQPLSLIDIVLSYNSRSEVQNIKEASFRDNIFSISSDFDKRNVAFFIAEVLYRALRAQEQDSGLFRFLENSVITLDKLQNIPLNYHLGFLLKLTHFLGFYPGENQMEDDSYFDMVEGIYCNRPPLHQYYFDQAETVLLKCFLSENIEKTYEISIGNSMRSIFLEKIIQFYKLHIDGFGNLKSLSVMRELYS